MSEVYKARDTRLDRTVAVKILPSADLEQRQRFEREARAIAALSHPNICTLHDIGHAASRGSASTTDGTGRRANGNTSEPLAGRRHDLAGEQRGLGRRDAARRSA